MSTDRELLELAAKAEGTVYQEPSIECVHRGGPVFLRPDGGLNFQWDPLIDDADALRLLAKLRLTLDYRLGFVGVHSGYGPYIGQCPHDEDKPHDTAATRRAIVRAAAEIGRSMK